MNLRKNWSKLFHVVLCLVIPFTLFQLEAFGGNTKKNKAKTQDKQVNLWKAVEEESLTLRGRRLIVPGKYLVFRLNQKAFNELLPQIPLEFSEAAREKQVILEIPTPEGATARFRVEESPILSPEIAGQFPDLKTFSGQGIDDPTAVARFSWTASGFQAYVLGINGTFLVDPYQENDRENYVVYNKNDDGANKGSFHCRLDELLSKKGQSFANSLNSAPVFSNGANLKTYRIAVATTGEYTIDRGGQAAAYQDVINAVNRISTIYRRDLSVSFTLVSDQRSVFPDPATDPYDNTDSVVQLNINQTQLDTIYTSGGYDIGHLFGTGGGGLAFSPVVCDTADKAKGYSARVPPTGDPFWVDYVAHEIGHQFSAQHTYNTNEIGTCSTRSDADAFEVASGATIMSYVGICGARNLQRFSIDDFHVRSLTQIIADLNNTANSGGCGTTAATGNSLPTVNAGANFTIPKLTPFTLTATGADTNGDVITYSWEQYDLAPSPPATMPPATFRGSGPNGLPAGTYDVDTDGVQRPLFRVYAPTTNRTRTYPSLPYILNNANTPPLTFTGTSPTGAVCAPMEECVTGENLPSIARTMNFRVVVRDNRATGGGIVDAGMTVTVVNTPGPFQVTAQNLAPVTWRAGTTQTVTWDVAGTTANGINAATVNILLSTDGGNTFLPMPLAAETLNDGTEQITVPNNPTAQARIKVEAVGNIFFDINNVNFAITAPTAASADLGGRILTASGAPIRSVTVSLVDLASGATQTTRTNSRGYYRFNEIPTGANYIISPSRLAYSFAPPQLFVNHLEENSNMDFTAVGRGR